MLAYLRLCVYPDDEISFQRVINVPRRWIGPVGLGNFFAWAREDGLKISEALMEIWNGVSPVSLAKDKRWLEGFRTFAKLLFGFIIHVIISAVVGALYTGVYSDLARRGDAVSLMTLHRAKDSNSRWCSSPIARLPLGRSTGNVRGRAPFTLCRDDPCPGRIISHQSGLIYGLIWWIIGGNIIQPVISGGDVLQLDIAGNGFFGHIIYGQTLAWIVSSHDM